MAVLERARLVWTSLQVCMDVGSSERLAMQSLQIPDTAETMIIPKWLFPPRFSDKIDLSPAVQMLYWLLHPRGKKKALD